MSATFRAAVVIAAIAVAPACNCQEEISNPTPKLGPLMRNHAELAKQSRDALVFGDLEPAKQSVRKLAYAMTSVPHTVWNRKDADRAQYHAETMGNASTVKEASLGFAKLTVACARCHSASDVEIATTATLPEEGRGLGAHMRRHHWAVDAMWLALLRNSTDGFRDAASVLKEAPLHGDVEPTHERPPGATALANRVHDLAYTASLPEEVDADSMGQAAEGLQSRQAKIFADLILTCHRCHNLVDAKISTR